MNTKNDSQQNLLIRKWGTALGVILFTMLLDQFFTFTDESFSYHVSSSKPSTPPQPRKPASDPSAPRLIFITLDGVRPDEFMDCKRLARREHFNTENCSFPLLWKKVANDRFHTFPMRVGNSKNLSLPGYESIYGGRNYDHVCISNSDCQRIPDETWLEELKRELNLPKSKVAGIASWAPLRIALEKFEGSIFTNSGQTAMIFPSDTGISSESLNDLNREMRDNPPELWENARLDSYTFPYSYSYLDKIRPHVLSVSFLDSDEWGHLDRFRDYKKALQKYDEYIDQFVKFADTTEDYQDNTIFMITTDHGRGKGWFGKAFKGHGPDFWARHSKKTWFAISVPTRLRPLLDTLWKEYDLEKKPDQFVIRKLVTRLMLGKESKFESMDTPQEKDTP